MQLHKQLGRADKRLARLPLLEAFQGASMRLAIFLVVLLHSSPKLNTGEIVGELESDAQFGAGCAEHRRYRQNRSAASCSSPPTPRWNCSHGRSPWRARVRASKVEALGRGRVDDAGVVLLSRIQFAFVVTFPSSSRRALSNSHSLPCRLLPSSARRGGSLSGSGRPASVHQSIAQLSLPHHGCHPKLSC